MYRSMFYGEIKFDRDKQNLNSSIIIITIAFFVRKWCKLILNEHNTGLSCLQGQNGVIVERNFIETQTWQHLPGKIYRTDTKLLKLGILTQEYRYRINCLWNKTNKLCISRKKTLRPKDLKARCDFILPDVHLLSVYLLVKILKWKKHERN